MFDCIVLKEFNVRRAIYINFLIALIIIYRQELYYIIQHLNHSQCLIKSYVFNEGTIYDPYSSAQKFGSY